MIVLIYVLGYIFIGAVIGGISKHYQNYFTLRQRYDRYNVAFNDDFTISLVVVGWPIFLIGLFGFLSLKGTIILLEELTKEKD